MQKIIIGCLTLAYRLFDNHIHWTVLLNSYDYATCHEYLSVLSIHKTTLYVVRQKTKDMTLRGKALVEFYYLKLIFDKYYSRAC